MNRTWLKLTVGVFMALVASSVFAQGKGEVPDSLFDKAVEFIKRVEGWHGNHLPYVGYGHKILPHEKLTADMTEAQADSLLRADLRKLYKMCSRFGKDALLLSEISDNRSYPNPSIILKIQFFIL